MRFARFSRALVPFVSFLAIAACTASSTSSGTDPGTSGTNAGAGKDGGGGGAATDGASGGGTVCERACQKSASAGCSAQSSCVSDCEADLAKIPASCKDQADAAMECAATKATAWKCDAKGKAVVTAGCDDETGALVSCVLGGGQDAGGGDGGSCGTLTSGNAACDACVNKSCCAQAAACSADAQCGAILDCFSGCNDDACYTKCENAHPSGVAKEQAFYSCLGTTCKAACQ